MSPSQPISASAVEAFADEMQKIAEEFKRKSILDPVIQLADNPWGNLALGIGAMGAGTAVGAGLGTLVKEVVPKSRLGKRFSRLRGLERSKWLIPAGAAAGGLSGLGLLFKTMSNKIYDQAATNAYLKEKAERIEARRPKT